MEYYNKYLKYNSINIQLKNNYSYEYLKNIFSDNIICNQLLILLNQFITDNKISKYKLINLKKFVKFVILNNFNNFNFNCLEYLENINKFIVYSVYESCIEHLIFKENILNKNIKMLHYILTQLNILNHDKLKNILDNKKYLYNVLLYGLDKYLQIQIINILLDMKPNVIFTINESTFLMLICELGEINLLKRVLLMIEKELKNEEKIIEEINKKNKYAENYNYKNKTALEIACTQNNIKIVELLIKKGAVFDETYLYLLDENNINEIIKQHIINYLHYIDYIDI
jgi:hypothetical protein